MLFNILDNHDSIIDNEADSQHHGEQRQRIDGKVQYHESRQRTDKGYRHSQQRDECCAPALQEDKDYQHYQQKRFNKGFQHLVNRSIDVVG